MFRTHFQGGAVVEIFSGQGKDPVAKWKLCGGPSAIHKEYNKEVRGYVYCLKGSSQTVKMQMPENGKMCLGLLQRYLVLQVNIPKGKDFSVELVITDIGHLKRRLHISTVHKDLSATLWHAKIPFIALQRNIWTILCIDLVSFIGELFSDTGFLTLDGITLFATCKVRRIFTMKTKPPANDELSLSGPGLLALVPRSCQFPPHVNHVSRLLNMETLQRAPENPDCAPDQSTADTSPSNQNTRLHTPSSSRAAGPPPLSRRKSSTASDGSLFSTSDQKSVAESERFTHMIDNLSNGESFPEGTPGSLQPHHQKDRVPDKQGFEKKKLASSYVVPDGNSKRPKSRGRCTSPLSRQEGRQQPLTRTGKKENLTADECHLSGSKKSFRAAPIPAESPSRTIQPGLSYDLLVRSSWESNEEPEPQLTLHEEVSSLHEVSTFSPQPHSPKQGQRQSDQEKMEMGDNQVQSKRGQRYDAQLEDDFFGSESEEPANQGHHYQKEISPLQCSNSREWMDLLSPPIMPPGQQRRSDNTGNHSEDVIEGEDEPVKEEPVKEEKEYLELLYDPCLNCYFDPETGKYYSCVPIQNLQSPEAEFEGRLRHTVARSPVPIRRRLPMRPTNTAFS